jgi:hypothetical protein
MGGTLERWNLPQPLHHFVLNYQKMILSGDNVINSLRKKELAFR